MRDFIQKTGRVLGQALLSVLAFALIIIALAQIGLMAAFSLLNTGLGRDIVQDTINQVTANQGYQVNIGSLYYDPVRGFTAHDVVMHDQTGTLISLKAASLSIAFKQLLIRHLDVTLTGQGLSIERLPVAQETAQDTTPLQPFTLPDLYVTRVTARMAIKDVHTSGVVTGTPLSLSPALSMDTVLSDAVRTALILKPNADSGTLPAPLPDTIELRGVFDPQSLALSVQKAQIESTAYTIDAQGEGSFMDNGALSYTLNARYPDLTGLTGDALRSAELTAALKGTLSKPEVTVNSLIVPESLKKQGLSDITLSVLPDLEAALPKALIKIETQYKDAPILTTAHVSYDAPTLTLESWNAQAPYLLADGHVQLDTQTMLAEGNLTLEAKDFSHYKDLIGLTLAGTARAEITLAPQDTKQSLRAKADIKNFKYDTISVASAKGEAFIADISHPWPQEADLQARTINLSKDLTMATLDASIKAAANDHYTLTLKGDGRMRRPFSVKAGADLSELQGAFPSARNITATATMGQSTLSLSGDLTPEKVMLTAKTSGLRIADLPSTLPRTLSAVRVNAEASMTGTPAEPISVANVVLSGFDTGKYQGLTITVDAKHEQGKARATVNGKGTGIRELAANADIPLGFSLYPFALTFTDIAPLSGDLLADLDLTPLAALFLPANQSFTGDLKANGTIGGTIAAPDINGTAKLSNGVYKGIDTGIDIAAIQMDAAFNQQSVTINSLSATDGEQGTLQGRGLIGLAGGPISNFSLTANRFHIPKEGMADGYLSADLALNDRTDGYTLGGTITVNEMSIQIPERFKADIPELNIIRKRDAQEDTSPAKSLMLDIALKAENQVFVRGWGLDAEFAGDIAISGDATAPQFDGTLKSRRGRYDEFGKRFELARANLRFQGSIPPSPYIDVEATSQADDVLASVILSGSVQKPAINFSSVPSLPEDEVLARILFGKSTTRISPFQAVQLTQTLQRFSGNGGGGLDPLGTLRALTGLDDISVETNEAGETNVGVGKYLTDKVYLEFERGKAENSGAASLQVEVTPSINVETEVGQDARAGGGVFWRRDY